MTTTRTRPNDQTTAARAASRSRARRCAAVISSIWVVALACSWWWSDLLWFFDAGGPRAEISLLTLVDRPVLGAVFLALGALGALGAVRLTGRPLVALAAVQALSFGVLASDAGVLIVVGYLIALATPVLLVLCVVWLGRRRPVLGLGAAVLALAAVVAGLQTIDLGAIQNLAAGLLSALATTVLPHLVVATFVGHGVLWAIIGLHERGRMARDSAQGSARSDAAPRWRVPITLVAALCALPYGLVRLTWLTDDPWGTTQAALEAEPGIRVMGLLLALAGVGGAVLTIGLLRPWGLVAPRWLPVIGGKAVPPLVPTLAATTIGLVIAVAGRSVLQALIMEELAGGAPDWIDLALLPLPVWGPALVLAAWAYHAHARSVRGRLAAGEQDPGVIERSGAAARAVQG